MVQTALARLDCRLLTLLGTGGIGKTRLALAVAEAVSDQFADGVCFVDLTQISDAATFPSLLATQLGLQQEDRSPFERVKGYLADQHLLLVLDNCEHVLPIALVVAEILTDCPDVTILATSREPLRLRWEHRLVVSPLDLPDLHRLPALAEVRTIPAVALFLQRARAINMRFAADHEMLRQIAALCVRLEGIPLAIELAARRTNVLSPAVMLHRLEASASVLQQRAPDVPTRHESIQATLDWSYDLLSQPEQAVFRRLGVFVGGFSLEAAGAIAVAVEADGASALESLSSLIDKGLILSDAGGEREPHYRLLETIRAYALEKLHDTPDKGQAASVHAHYYLSLAEEESAHVRSAGYLVFSPRRDGSNTTGRGHAPWLIGLDRAYANLQAALSWAEAHDDNVLLRLGCALARYWWTRAYLLEGIRWLGVAIERNPNADPELRSRALGGLGIMYRQRADFARARALLEEAVALARALDNSRLLAAHLVDLGAVLGNQRHVTEAAGLFEESAALSRAGNDPWGLAVASGYRGWLSVVARRSQDAEAYLAESVALFRDLGDYRSLATANRGIAQAHVLQGDVRSALPFLDNALRLCRDLNDEASAPIMIEVTARVAALSGSPGECARLLGAGEALRTRGFARVTDERDFYEETLAAVQSELAQETLAAALDQGRQLSVEQALDEAIALVQTAMSAHTQATAKPKRAESGQLSRRELGVLQLLTEGCTNKEIGRRLGFSENTAKFHVTSILTKLGVNSRTEAVSVAVKRGLL